MSHIIHKPHLEVDLPKPHLEVDLQGPPIPPRKKQKNLKLKYTKLQTLEWMDGWMDGITLAFLEPQLSYH